jgi:hypothetical protein
MVTAVPSRATVEIEAEIARTRVEIDRTLDGLTAELAPNHLVEKAANMVAKSWRSHGPGGSDLGDAVRADTAPLALIGLGVAWLVAEHTGLLDNIAPRRSERRTEEPSGDNASRANRAKGSVEAVSHALDACPPIGETSAIVVEPTDECVEKAAGSGGRAYRVGKRLSDRFEHNPLLFGLAGIVCGALIAMLAPSSRREQELVASAREDLWKKAEELGHRAADSIRAMGTEPTGTTAED